MKRLSLFLLSVFALFFTANAKEGHNIKIRIKGLPKDTTCYIGYHYGKNQYIKQDTAKADATGTLTFKGKEPLPGGVYVLTIPHNYMEFLVSEQNFTLETDTAELLLHMKIKGSVENEVFYDYQKLAAVKGRE